MIFTCKFCSYKSDRTYNLRRHYNTKHDCDIPTEPQENVPETEEQTMGSNQSIVTFANVDETREFVEGKNKIYTCKKCKKGYNTKKNYQEHEKKCNFLNVLTCPKCMVEFSNRHNKTRHIKSNICKSKSITLANIDNAWTTVPYENAISNAYNNIQTQNNNCHNNINTQNNNCKVINHIYINNYGTERLDHLDNDKCMQIFAQNYDIPSIMTKEIHFNPDFPENNNIRYINDKTAMIKADDQYVYRSLNDLVEEIIKDKTRYIQKFARENKDNICARLSTEIYEEIIELCLKLIIMKEPSSQYRIQVNKIMDMIKYSHAQLAQYSNPTQPAVSA